MLWINFLLYPEIFTTINEFASAWSKLSAVRSSVFCSSTWLQVSLDEDEATKLLSALHVKRDRERSVLGARRDFQISHSRVIDPGS